MLESSSTQLAAEPRLPLWKRLPALSAAVPLVLVVYLVFQEEVRLLSPEAPAQPALSVLAAPPAGALAAFVGEELDRRLEVLEFEVDELSGLKRDAW
jgi:hypothetical protein